MNRLHGLTHLRRRTRGALLLGAVIAAAASLQLLGANPAVSQSVVLSAYDVEDDPGLDPNAAAWTRTRGIQLPLSAQVGTYAAGGGSVATADVRALHYEGRLFIRVAWRDATEDASTARPEDFADAVALEFPASAKATVPSICMGQADAAVNIWHWRADLNAGIKTPEETFVNTLTDQTDMQPAFYTARDVQNPFANPEAGPVQTLIAFAFGTLAPAGVQEVEGKGVRTGNGWAVVFSRPFASRAGQANFASGQRTDLAVAIWNGSEGDRNGQKSVSQFARLSIASTGATQGTNVTLVALLAVGVFVGLTGLGAAVAIYGLNEGKRR